MRVQGWVKELRKVVGSEIKLAIAGNKSDLEKQRVVTVKDAEAYAESIGAGHYSTSARSVRLGSGAASCSLPVSVPSSFRLSSSSVPLNSPPRNTRTPTPHDSRAG